MPEPNLSPHDPDLEIHIDALERARLTRANIRGLWDAHYEVEQNAFARAHPSATWPHRDDVFLRTAGHDAWVVAFASRQAQPQRHMSGVPAMRAARTSVGVLFAALLFGLLGVRRQRGIYIAVSSLGIEVDGQRVPADDIEDVLITGGRFVVVTHGGEFVRSRVLPDPFAAHEILEAAKQQRSTLTEHYEAQTAEANLQGAAARLRERA